MGSPSMAAITNDGLKLASMTCTTTAQRVAASTNPVGSAEQLTERLQSRARHQSAAEWRELFITEIQRYIYRFLRCVTCISGARVEPQLCLDPFRRPQTLAQSAMEWHWWTSNACGLSCCRLNVRRALAHQTP